MRRMLQLSNWGSKMSEVARHIVRVCRRLGVGCRGCDCCGLISPLGGEAPHALTADVNRGSFLRILLGLPQNLVCYRSCVPFAEGNVLEEIRQRIALAPPEINMGYFPGQVSQVEQERGNSVRYG